MLKRTSVSLAIVFLFAAACSAQEKKVCISGRVLDDSKHAVPHATVVVYDRQSHARIEVKTDGNGRYQAWHDPGTSIDLEVIPPLKSGLAQVMLSNVPAEEGQNMLIMAHEGFELRGRVLCDGKPLKNAHLTITAVDGDTVHGGGRAVANRHGDFALVLTPGAKDIEIADERSNPPKVIAHRNVSISSNCNLQDISVTSDLAQHP